MTTAVSKPAQTSAACSPINWHKVEKAAAIELVSNDRSAGSLVLDLPAFPGGFKAGSICMHYKSCYWGYWGWGLMGLVLHALHAYRRSGSAEMFNSVWVGKDGRVQCRFQAFAVF